MCVCVRQRICEMCVFEYMPPPSHGVYVYSAKRVFIKAFNSNNSIKIVVLVVAKAEAVVFIYILLYINIYVVLAFHAVLALVLCGCVVSLGFHIVV